MKNHCPAQKLLFPLLFPSDMFFTACPKHLHKVGSHLSLFLDTEFQKKTNPTFQCDLAHMLKPCLEKLSAQNPGHLICRTLDFSLFLFMVVCGDWVYRPLSTWPSTVVFAISLS